MQSHPAHAQLPRKTSSGHFSWHGYKWTGMKALLVYICLELACNGNEINDDRDYLLWTDKWQSLGIFYKWPIYKSLKLRIMTDLLDIS